MSQKAVENPKNHIKTYNAFSDHATMVFVYAFTFLMALCVLVPLVFVIAASFSSPDALLSAKVFLWPVDFTLRGYKMVVEHDMLPTGFKNTIIYALLGTSINIFMTVIAAYPLSRKDLKIRNAVMMLFAFTMLFNGGLVPTYIMYTQLFHIRDTIWALIVPNLLLSPFNVILVRNYFRTNIPDSIVEAAKLDGASDLQTLTRVVLPISSPILGTIGLLSGLAYWNNWTNGLYYLVKRTDLYSIQNVLTNMLNNIQFLKTSAMDGINLDLSQLPSVGIRMAIAVIALIPVMIAYPLIQKSFVKGIVVGGVKG